MAWRWPREGAAFLQEMRCDRNMIALRLRFVRSDCYAIVLRLRFICAASSMST
jgi:hypothetical protein